MNLSKWLFYGLIYFISKPAILACTNTAKERSIITVLVGVVSLVFLINLKSKNDDDKNYKDIKEGQ